MTCTGQIKPEFESQSWMKVKGVKWWKVKWAQYRVVSSNQNFRDAFGLKFMFDPLSYQVYCSSSCGQGFQCVRGSEDIVRLQRLKSYSEPGSQVISWRAHFPFYSSSLTTKVLKAVFPNAHIYPYYWKLLLLYYAMSDCIKCMHGIDKSIIQAH